MLVELGYLGAHLPEEGALQLLHALLGVEEHGLVLLELRGDEPLPANQCLTPGVIVWDMSEIGVADLYVVAEDPVVAHLQRPDAGAVTLGALQAGDVPASVSGNAPQLVQLRGEALPDDSALTWRSAGRVLQGTGYQRGH